MRTFIITAIFFLLNISVRSQSVIISPAPLNSSINVGLGYSNYHVSEYIYKDAEIGNTSFTTVSTAINQVFLNLDALGDMPSQVFYHVKIYMKQVSAATTGFSSGTYSTAGYTQVYDGSFPATTPGWMGVSLTTPFLRTPGLNLQMMIERTDNIPAAAFVFPPFWTTTTGVPTGARMYNGTNPLSGTTTLSTSSSRVVVKFNHAPANDASISIINTIGKLPFNYGGSNEIRMKLSNVGAGSISSLIDLTLTITGANAYSGTGSVGGSFSPGVSYYSTYYILQPVALGNNVITASISDDGDNSNNTFTTNLITTATTYALSNDDAFTPGESIGFGTGSGNLLVKMPVYKTNRLTGVRISISADAETAGNVVYGVLLSSAGMVMAQSPNYTIKNSDLGQYVTFNFPSAQLLTPGTYYIGLAQTTNSSIGYYPVNTQLHRPNISHITSLIGGTITDYDYLGSLMIEGNFASTFPVTITSFSGIKERKGNRLSWNTSSEANNKGFDLERSADGRSFSSIGFVATKAYNGNSAVALSYDFTDERILTGSNYYRLKQIDRDGKFTYSSVVMLKGDKNNLLISSAYPNPTKGQLNLAIISPSNEKAALVITDLSGKVVTQLTTSLIQGENNVTVNVHGFSSGIYSVRLISNGETQTAWFVKN